MRLQKVACIRDEFEGQCCDVALILPFTFLSWCLSAPTLARLPVAFALADFLRVSGAKTEMDEVPDRLS